MTSEVCKLPSLTLCI